MTTHVFVVDANTFNVHLKYLFAGTGAKEYAASFNNCADTDMSHSVENMLVSMSADAMRIRKGDKILFYLQQKIEMGVREGKFYGVFEAAENWSFLDDNDGEQYLYGGELTKSLTYRTLIKPQEVYAEGVTEWAALDDITNIKMPYQMQWSLIYRKLKGNRGNTMITIDESDRLCELIRQKNDRQLLEIGQRELGFDIASQSIVVKENRRPIYVGRKTEINVLPRLIRKYGEGKAFEAHLQSYIVKNLGLGENVSLDNAVLGTNYQIEWLGNEMSCGVGMQRIDVALSVNRDDEKIFIPIELKAVEASSDNVRQVNRYVNWIEQYYIPNRLSEIEPVVIARRFDKSSPRKRARYDEVMEKFREFNDQNAHRCRSIKYIEYEIVNGDLHFEIIEY